MTYSTTFVNTFHSMTLAFLSDHKKILLYVSQSFNFFTQSSISFTQSSVSFIHVHTQFHHYFIGWTSILFHLRYHLIIMFPLSML